jgi:antitoxin component of RelBE/YafQ-DinJ toxin-antitoxin module
MNQADRAKEKALQRLNIVEHVKAGHTAYQIADAEGLDPDDARQKRRRIAKEEGLPILRDKRSGLKAIGMNERNEQVRARLGFVLKRLTDERKMNPYQIARLVGLTMSEQRDAVDRTKGHNWTLAQIQRLADASGSTFEEIMTHIMTTPPIGFGSKS